MARPGRSSSPKTPGRFRGFWIVLALVAVAVLAYPWYRPMLSVGERCHPDGAPTVQLVKLDVCVDPGVWQIIISHERGKLSFGEPSHDTYFDTITRADAVPLADLRGLVLKYAEQYATNAEGLEIVKEGEATLGGRTWQSIEFLSETAAFIDYYYSADGFGSAQLFFLSQKPKVARRDEVAAPILASVKFTDTPG